MPEKMTHHGVGPKFMVLCAVYCVPTFVARYLYPMQFSIRFVPYWVLAAVGGVLVVLGMVLHEAAVPAMKRAFSEGRLLTRGAFGMCRHPIYACVVVFLAPGIMLIINSWIGLVAVLPMYVTLLVIVRPEDRYLEEKFGDEYRAYRKRVPAALPLGWLRRRPPGEAKQS